MTDHSEGYYEAKRAALIAETSLSTSLRRFETYLHHA